MTAAKALPWAVILIGACASIVYAFNGEWRQALYWFAAALVNFAVTI